MFHEFKKFIQRGNVLDLAVGVIIGTAFSGIVTSLVNNIFTPIIGILFGGVDFTGLAFSIKDSTIMYGAFIQTVFDFLVTAFCLFIIVKVINRFNSDLKKLNKKKEEVIEEVVVPKSDEVLLLEEIRDLLKDNKKSERKKK